MEVSTCDMDAKLLEQFSALGTTDKDELVCQLKAVVGGNISTESCQFYLDLAGWNLQRAVGSYFDFTFDDAPPTSITTAACNETNYSCVYSATYTSQTSRMPAGEMLYDLRIWPSSSGSSGTSESFKVTVENSGSSPWNEGTFIRSEFDPKIAKLSTKICNTESLAWSPIGIEGRIPLPSVPPGQLAELEVKVDAPDTSALETGAMSVTGALSFCLPNGEAFGETLYCTAYRDLASQTWVFRRGVPENTDTRDSEKYHASIHENEQPTSVYPFPILNFCAVRNIITTTTKHMPMCQSNAFNVVRQTGGETQSSDELNVTHIDRRINECAVLYGAT